MMRCCSAANQRATIGASWLRSPRSTAVLAAVSRSRFVFRQDPIGIGWTVPAPVTLAVLVLAVGVGAIGLGWASRRTDWTAGHSLMATTGALATCCRSRFFVQSHLDGSTAAGLVAQLVLVALVGGLLVAARRQQRSATPA